MNRCKYALILLIAALLPGFANAGSKFAGRWYQVELIVFSHLTSKALDSEQWPALDRNSALPQGKLISLIPANSFQNAAAFKILPRSQFILQEEQRHLNNTADYQVLLHLSWRQQVWTQKKSQPIHLFGGAVYDNQGNKIATDRDGSMPYNANNIWQVNGTMQLSVQHYLDAQFNLLFSAPTAQIQRLSRNNYFANTPNKFVYFRLLQNRRMRSKELNYIGHPLYGVLIKILPIETKNKTTPIPKPNTAPPGPKKTET